MKQYLKLLQEIKERGTYKPAAREGMPGTQSLFGYQFRHNLQDGFPLLTTKKMFWKGVVVELLWFLRGDTNIKYLVDNGVNIWNEDAYNYYIKLCNKQHVKPWVYETWLEFLKEGNNNHAVRDYKIGDCGYQYGKVWRDWEGPDFNKTGIDQIKNIINSLRKTPESRRHIVTAIDPAHETDLALYWCHAMFQFNCRPLDNHQKLDWLKDNDKAHLIDFRNHPSEPFGPDTKSMEAKYIVDKKDFDNIPKYYLDCQLYQRSADVFLGVPFNIASYALLTHILAKICNMIPGEFVHTFGDVHIYDNHIEAVNEQLSRTPSKLPTLKIEPCPQVEWENCDVDEILKSIEGFEMSTFNIQDYNPQSTIKAELSTGLIK